MVVQVYKQTPWFSESNPMPNTTSIFFDRAIELNPQAKFIIRLYIQQPDHKPAWRRQPLLALQICRRPLPSDLIERGPTPTPPCMLRQLYDHEITAVVNNSTYDD